MAAYPEAELQLYEQLQIIGNGQGRNSPALQHERWLITHISTSSTSDPSSPPTVIHYRNFVHPSMQLEGTYSGNLDNDTTANFPINPGECIITVVTGATPGSITWVRYEGTRWIPYQGYS